MLDKKANSFRKNPPLSAVRTFLASQRFVLWLDMERPSKDELETLKAFRLHPLTIEDCIHYQSLPKMDIFPSYLFLVMHGIHYDPRRKETKRNEIDFICGRNYLITVHQETSVSVDSVKARCEGNSSFLSQGPDLLMHAVIDSMIDRYLPVVDYWDERIEQMEAEILSQRSADTMLPRLLEIKRRLLQLKRSIVPQRDIIGALTHTDSPFVSKTARLYFRDVYDNVQRAYASVEIQRDLITSAYEAYLSMVSNRLNVIVQRLTLVTTVFMPLSFIAGIYGMNFRYMPELEWRYGYFAILGLMLAVGIGMFIYFRKKKWV